MKLFLIICLVLVTSVANAETRTQCEQRARARIERSGDGKRLSKQEVDDKVRLECVAFPAVILMIIELAKVR